MKRPLVSRLLSAGLITAGAVPVAVLFSPTTAFAADIDAACTGDLVGTTFTLTEDCATMETLTVPATITTVDGGNNTISATDIGSDQWDGAILTNATPGQTMTIQNLTVEGPVGGFQVCTEALNSLVGILFADANGSLNNVIVDHIWQQPNPSDEPSCQTGRAIVARGIGTQRTVTITNTTVRDYQKNGIEARGTVTMNVSGSTMGPPNNQEGLIAQNGLAYVLGASGTAANNPAIYGSGDNAQPPPEGPADGTAVILYGATNVTVDHNTIIGAKTDIGIAVVAGSTGIVISFNSVTRSAPDTPDLTGIGIGVNPPGARVSVTDAVDPVGEGAAATLICNTFSGWIAGRNIVGAVQISCVPHPTGTECENYSAAVLAVEGGVAPFVWSVVSGTLPPGLSMAPATGAITGVPTSPGTFNFTVQVADSSTPALTATQPHTITIAPGCPTTTTSTTTTTPAVLPPTPTTAAGSGGQLPTTGPTSDSPVFIGLLVLVLGAILVAVTRRRVGASKPS